MARSITSINSGRPIRPGATHEVHRRTVGRHRDHPYGDRRTAFLRRLADGTLHRDIFRHYLGQDWLYLRDYATALAQLAVQAPDGSATSFFALAAHGANEEAERLHATHVADPDRVVKSPVCQAYTDFLLATGLRAGYAVQAAAVLPCFWIYTDVGQRLWEQAGQHPPDHPYADWLAAYGDPVFAEQTDRARALVDQAAAAATPDDPGADAGGAPDREPV